MASGAISRPIGVTAGWASDLLTKGTNVSKVEGLITTQGRLVCVNIRITFSGSPSDTETILTGFPLPFNDQNICVSKINGYAQECMLTSTGTLRNNWATFNSGTYVTSFTYLKA